MCVCMCACALPATVEVHLLLYSFAAAAPDCISRLSSPPFRPLCAFRAIYELAVSQSDLDMPEQLWRAYMDFEIAEGEMQHVRALYERLLERSGHVKVWISFGQFEADVAAPAGASDAARAREVFARG